MRSWLLSFLNNWGSIFSSGSGGFSSSNNWDTGGSDREETVGEGTNYGSVVDDVVGGVGGSVLLDSDLGHVVDGGSGDGSNGGSLNLDGLDSSDRGSSWSSNSVGGGGNNGGSSNDWNCVGDGVDEAVLVNVLRK